MKKKKKKKAYTVDLVGLDRGFRGLAIKVGGGSGLSFAILSPGLWNGETGRQLEGRIGIVKISLILDCVGKTASDAVFAHNIR